MPFNFGPSFSNSFSFEVKVVKASWVYSKESIKPGKSLSAVLARQLSAPRAIN
jgi:hypothetical protein